MTRQHKSLVTFDFVQRDDVDGLVAQLNEQPYLMNMRNEVAQTLLIAAAQCGSAKVLRELLRRNVLNTNETDQDETTALIAAAKENHEECVTALFNSGAELSMTDKDGWGAITWAAYRGHVNVVRLLLAWEANPNEVGQHGMNPLIWAAGRGHSSVVEELLSAGANPDSCDKYGTSALVWAARKGHVDVMKLLLDMRANIDQSGTNGWTPLIMAAKGGFEEAVSVLLSYGADVNFLDQHNNSALVWAVKQGYAAIVRKLAEHGAFINIRNKEGIPVLTLASKEGHVDIVRILLEHYADVEAVDPVGQTALWCAVEKDHGDIVKELLEFGAFTECRRKDGETPLLLAVRKKYTEVTSLLLEKNADLSASNKKGDTALHIAVRCRYRRIAELLLKDPKSARLLYQSNRTGETPYHIDHRHKKSVLKPVLGMAEGDRQHTEELLGHDVYTTSLAELLCEPSLEVPLTVGVYARWGSSKVHFFKRLQQEMNEITFQTVRPKLRFTYFGVLSCLFFCAVLGICFCSIFNWIIGVAVGSAVFILCHITFLTMLVWENKCCKNRDSSWISVHFRRFAGYFHLLYLIIFCIPPTLTSMRSSLPVRFIFADFSKLTRSNSEATALISMIETLNEVIEGCFGCVATRLYRVLRPPPLDYARITHSQPQYKKCCCCLPKLCIFFFVVLCGALAVVCFTEVGSDGGSVIAGLQISGACIVGIAIVVHSTTLCSVLYTLLFSPKRRVSIVATQLGLKEEGFIHALKQEVELLTEVVIAMDGFKKIQTRIILFLDGLDNSEQQKVLHLVDSINLLFTDPDAPFISIIAIDPRVTVRAIEQNFSNVLQDSHITALDYLKSIIHLPLFLPEPKTSCSGNLPDSLRLSVETLLRQRKHSGFELEWEGENFELFPDFTLNLKSNGVLSTKRHSAVLTVDHTQTGEGKFRLNRSCLDIHLEKHDESPDLTHVLADNETLTPLGIQRLLHTTSLSGRLLRAKGFNFHWNSLATWVSLVDSWPYRVSWLVLVVEEFTTVLPDNISLTALYAATQAWLPNSSGFDYAVDNDPVYFESFLGSHFPILKVEDLRKFLVGTVNLDPAIRNQISQGLQASSCRTLNKTESAGTGGSGLGQTDPIDLAGLTEEDVCIKLSLIEGIQLTSVPSYQATVRENHISGRVLCECDISELRDVMEMNFGDWQLFRAWILRQRPNYTRRDSGCNSAWVDGQVDKVKADSVDTYVEMGNLSCVRSSSSKSQEGGRQENQKTCRRDPVRINVIPRIVLDPGSSLNSDSNCEHTKNEANDEYSFDAEANTEHPRVDIEKKLPMFSSNDVRELYSITPHTSMRDSSEDESSGTESTLLVKNKLPEVKRVELAQNSTSQCDESRPLLSRQPEIDQSNDPLLYTNLDMLDNIHEGCTSKHLVSCVPEETSTTLKHTKDDDESRRVIPILFTVSPTNKGSSQVVSSVVATRDLSLALSRGPSLPGSPCASRSKGAKSPRPLRALFTCRSALSGDDNEDNAESTQAEKNSDLDPSAINRQYSQNMCNFNIGKKENGAVTSGDVAEQTSVSGGTSSRGRHSEWQAKEVRSFEADTMRSQNLSSPELSSTTVSSLDRNDVTLSEDTLKDPKRAEFSGKTLPENVRGFTHRSLSQDSSIVNGCSRDNSFESGANNSDKGYESVDNSPSCVENGDCRSMALNGSVSLKGLSETTNPIWLPLMESKTFPRLKKPSPVSADVSPFLSQTMV